MTKENKFITTSIQDDVAYFEFFPKDFGIPAPPILYKRSKKQWVQSGRKPFDNSWCFDVLRKHLPE